MLTKLSTETYHRVTAKFIVECYDPLLGDNTPDREVADEELLSVLGAKNGLIPFITECDDVQGEAMEHTRFIDLNEWLSEVGFTDILYRLECAINMRENRTEQRPLKQVDLPSGEQMVEYLKSIVSKKAA